MKLGYFASLALLSCTSATVSQHFETSECSIAVIVTDKAPEETFCVNMNEAELREKFHELGWSEDTDTLKSLRKSQCTQDELAQSLGLQQDDEHAFLLVFKAGPKVDPRNHWVQITNYETKDWPNRKLVHLNKE